MILGTSPCNLRINSLRTTTTAPLRFVYWNSTTSTFGVVGSVNFEVYVMLPSIFISTTPNFGGVTISIGVFGFSLPPVISLTGTGIGVVGTTKITVFGSSTGGSAGGIGAGGSASRVGVGVGVGRGVVGVGEGCGLTGVAAGDAVGVGVAVGRGEVGEGDAEGEVVGVGEGDGSNFL